MPSTGLKGPFLLTAERVNIAVTAALPGAYALGQTDTEGTFLVDTIGRSNDNLKKTLEDQIDGRSQFKFECFHSAKAAFEKECGLYHEFTMSMTQDHPTRPEGSYWKCPRCNVLD
jgi:hypothetical protein